MAERYFLKRGKTVKGPFSIKKLQELLAAQKLKANDLLAIHKDGPWERMAAVHKKLRAGTELIESQQPVDASTVSVSNNLISCTDCGTQVSKQAITCPNCGAPIGDADVSKESDDDYGDDDYGDDDYGDEDYPDSEYEEYIPKHRTPKPKQQSKNRKRNTKNRTSSESGMPVFVLAIVGVVLIPICLPIAWAMGAAYARRCNDAHTTPDSFGHIGRLIGKLFTYVWVLAIALGMVFLLRMLSMLASPNDVANNEVSTNEVSNNETKEDAQDAMDTDDHSPQIDYDQTKLNAKLNTLKIKVRLKFIRKHQLDAAFYQFYVAEGGDVEWNKAKGTLNATIAIESRKKEMRGAQIYLYFTQSDDTGGFFDYWTLQSFDTSEVALKEYYRQHVAGKLLKCLITGEKM